MTLTYTVFSLFKWCVCPFCVVLQAGDNTAIILRSDSIRGVFRPFLRLGLQHVSRLCLQEGNQTCPVNPSFFSVPENEPEKKTDAGRGTPNVYK